MSEINYFKIEDDLGAILRNDPRLKSKDNGGQLGNKGLVVEVEETFSAVSIKIPWCGIYLDSWEPLEERVAAGQKSLTFLNFELWLWEFSLKNREGAILRDRLMQKVMEVLKDNRKINDNVQIMTFQGGEFDNAKKKRTSTGSGKSAEFGFFKGVSIKIRAEVFQ